MKKIIILGGSYAQIPAIVTAKKMGLYVVTCDYLPNNIGHKYADEYYNVSTTDKEEVLKLAQKIDVDAVVCYASDPAAPTAAFVSEQLGLPTSPYQSVNILSNKDLFREFLKQNHFFTPKAKGYSSITVAIEELEQYVFPIIVKPVDSSGSKGITKLLNKDDLQKAVENALAYSRNKRFIIEEYIPSNGYPIAGDGFSVNGKLVFRAFANDHFNLNSSNPLAPMGESWPYIMPEHIHQKIHNEIQRLITLLDMKTTAYNFEARIDNNENVYLMEVAPRSGGNLIPQVTKYLTGVDMVEYTIKAALGEDCSDLHMEEPRGFWGCYMVHSQKSGKLKEIWMDPTFADKNLIEFEPLYKPGDNIMEFKGANGTLGTMILKFDSEEEMLDKMDHMDQWVKVIVDTGVNIENPIASTKIVGGGINLKPLNILFFTASFAKKEAA